MHRLTNLPYKYLVAIVFIFGLFMDLVDTTVVNVAIPKLSEVFDASTTTVEWTITAYLLSLALFIPAAGWLSDRFGTKRAYLTAMGLFVIASAACGQAHSIEELIIFRFLQGMGGGMMTPVGQAMLSREFPGAERAKAAAIMSVPIVFAPLTGPILGGFLVEYVNWRWIFYINLPVGLFGLLLGLKVLEEHKEQYAQRGFDLLGLLTGGLGAAMTLYALSLAGSKGWGSQPVVAFGVAGLLISAAFIFIELRVQYPILDLRLFKRKLFASSNAMMATMFLAFAGLLLPVTLYLQQLHGYSPLQAGLIQGPASLSTAIVLPLASRMYGRLGPRKMLLLGMGLATLTALPLLLLQLDSPWWLPTLLLALRGLPFPFAFVAAQTILFGPLDSDKQGAASSITNTLRQVAASLSVALMITISTGRMHTHEAALVAKEHLAGPTEAIARHAAIMGYHDAFLVGALMMLVPFAIAFLVRDKDVQDAMQRRAQPVPVAPEAAAEPV